MSRYRPIYPAFAAIDLVYKIKERRQAMYDETRLSGTYGSDIDPLDDIQCEDMYGDEPDYTLEDGDIYYEPDIDMEGDYNLDIDDNDEPLLYQDDIEFDDITEDFPF